MEKLVLVVCMVVAATAVLAAEGKEKPSPNILLAMEKTGFKTALIDEMAAMLKEHNADITLIKNHKKDIKGYKAADFDAVFITNSGVMSKVRPWIVTWLEQNAADSSKILLHTTKTKEWIEKVSVDAVSSASAKDRTKELAGEYVKRLLEKTRPVKND